MLIMRTASLSLLLNRACFLISIVATKSLLAVQAALTRACIRHRSTGSVLLVSVQLRQMHVVHRERDMLPCKWVYQRALETATTKKTKEWSTCRSKSASVASMAAWRITFCTFLRDPLLLSRPISDPHPDPQKLTESGLSFSGAWKI